MKTAISTTDAARNLGDYLARVRHTGARFVLMKNRTPVAELGPVPGGSVGTVADMWNAMREVGADDGFADDLARVNSADAVMENPWRS